MSDSKALVVQGTLSPVFAGFVNLEVMLAPLGKYKLEDLEKIMKGDPLVPGTELVVTSRYYVKDVHLPVTRRDTYDYDSSGRYRPGHEYQIAGAKVDLGFIEVMKVEAQKKEVKQTLAEPCSCLIQAEGKTAPEGYTEAAYPLKGWWARRDCRRCSARGYAYQRVNKAPLADEVRASYGAIITIVEHLPEAPDIPEAGCLECGKTNGHHHWDCPVKKQEEEEKAREAEAAKAAAKEAKKAAKQAGRKPKPEKPASCANGYAIYGRCLQCPKAEGCEQNLAKAKPAESLPTPACYGHQTIRTESCDECGIDEACKRITGAGEDADEIPVL